jgi:hypothetical protein
MSCLVLIHADGGALVLKTYAEFIDQHSEREAQRVIIGPGASGAA